MNAAVVPGNPVVPDAQGVVFRENVHEERSQVRSCVDCHTCGHPGWGSLGALVEVESGAFGQFPGKLLRRLHVAVLA